MGRHKGPDLEDPRTIEVFCRVLLETGSKRAAGRAAFPGRHPDNAARLAASLLEQPAVSERLEQLAGEDDRGELGPHGEPARRRVRRYLWSTFHRCYAEEPDTTPSALGRVAQVRAELRAQHALRCRHEPAAVDCAGCAA